MTNSRLRRVLIMVPLFVAGSALFGLVIMGLWNALMPAMFGWKPITYWQAWGLLLLSKILFGGFYGPGGRAGYRRDRIQDRIHERVQQRMQDRWEQMTPEEREAFRQWFRSRAGAGAAPESKPGGSEV